MAFHGNSHSLSAMAGQGGETGRAFGQMYAALLPPSTGVAYYMCPGCRDQHINGRMGPKCQFHKRAPQ